MISLQDIKDFCQLNYLDSGIPVYIYRNNTLLQAFPEQLRLCYPPKHYIEEFGRDDRRYRASLNSVRSLFCRCKAKRPDGTVRRFRS